MEKNDAIKWAKDHKKSFARQIIRQSGVEKSLKPTAIFLAGLPGSGKTELTKGLISNLKIKVIRLDMDEIASQIDTYTPQQADKYRAGASMLLSRTFDMVVKGGYDFIMDGTFGGKSAVQNIGRALSHGYDVKMIYIYQEPKVAWRYTKAREKVEHRAIDMKGFIESYYKTIENMKTVGEKFGGKVSVDLVVKDQKNRIKQVYFGVMVKDIDSFVKIEYNKDELGRSIL